MSHKISKNEIITPLNCKKDKISFFYSTFLMLSKIKILEMDVNSNFFDNLLILVESIHKMCSHFMKKNI